MWSCRCHLSLVLSLSLLNFKPQSMYHLSHITSRLHFSLQPRLISCAKNNRKCVFRISLRLHLLVLILKNRQILKLMFCKVKAATAPLQVIQRICCEVFSVIVRRRWKLIYLKFSEFHSIHFYSGDKN